MVRFPLLFIFIALVFVNAYSQEPTNTCYCIDSQEPEFPGGANEFTKYLHINLQKNLCVDLRQFSDSVLVQFTISKDGSLRDVSVIKGLNDEIDAEVVKFIYRSPPWKPGKRYGRPIEVHYTVPISLSRPI
jgi:periplasmic protein TonB